LTLAVSGAVALGATPAYAASEPITTTTLCCAFGKTAFTIDEGTVATFKNSDPGTSPHDVTSIVRQGAKPLFASAIIGLGEAPVNGTERLGPGSYRFYCTTHPTQMAGQLAVVGSGIPPKVKILSSDLGKVVSKRKLLVKLKATAVSNDVSLAARLGNKKLGSQTDIAVSAGASRTVALRLSRSGRNILDDLEAAQVKVTATVAGGKPASAKRRLG
jgi:plastocyanin